ncbi:MAG TPA: GGDEF domain-containing protein [Geomonas sp.]|nr:GGDEF domain-containing protein [Geomonas sp.]
MKAPMTGQRWGRVIDLAFGAAVLLLTVMFYLSYQIKASLSNSNRWTLHTYEVLSTLDDLQATVLEAESSRRGYVLSANHELRERFLSDTVRLPDLLQRLNYLTRDDRDQQQRQKVLADLTGRKIATMAASVNNLDRRGFRRVEQERTTQEGALLMSKIQSRIAEMKGDEQNLLGKRRDTEQRTVSVLFFVVWTGTAAGMLILLVTYGIARSEARSHRAAADALEAANSDIVNLSEMAQYLLSCSRLGEAGEIVSRYGARFFQGDSGGVYLFDSAREFLVESAGWGSRRRAPFEADQCWALRLGQPHLARQDSDLRCRHSEEAAADICIPLAAHHETLGVFHLATTSAETAVAFQGKMTMAVAFAEQVALGLRNLQLREQLRELSIRDPVTGLMNRRYMEESLLREMSRAVRKTLPLSVVMIDVDHFKLFNDSFGHEAGDMVLREFANLLERQLRGSDLACRYGGEEFILILPEASRESAREKAEMIRESVKQLKLFSGSRPLGKITISAGIALFPADGENSHQLLTAADAALYRAKEAGRDRVETAPGARKL